MCRQASAALPNLLSTVRTSQAPRVVLKGAAKLQEPGAEAEGGHEVVAHVAALPCSSKASVCCSVAPARSICSSSRSILASAEQLAAGASPVASGAGGPLPPGAPAQLVACGSYAPLVTRHPQLTRIALPASVGSQQGSSGSWSARGGQQGSSGSWSARTRLGLQRADLQPAASPAEGRMAPFSL